MKRFFGFGYKRRARRRLDWDQPEADWEWGLIRTLACLVAGGVLGVALAHFLLGS